MKKRAFILSLVLFLVAIPITQTSAAGEILLSDNFDGPTLNTQNWKVYISPGSEVFVANGGLHTVAYRDSEPNGDSSISPIETVSGDFEAQIKINNFEVPPSSVGGAEIHLFVSDNEYLILRWVKKEGTQSIELASVKPSSFNQKSALEPTVAYTEIGSVSSLTLKLVRAGTSAFGFVDTGNGFAQLVSLSDVSETTGRLWIATIVSSGRSGDKVSAVFDDFMLTSAALTPPGNVFLQILSPRQNARVSDVRPVISGKAPPNSTVTITIYSEPITATVVADQSGNWSYLPDGPLSPGPHNIVASALNPNTGQTEVVETFFVIGSDAAPIAGTTETTLFLMVAGTLFVLTGIAWRILMAQSRNRPNS